jgi:hypothetical protein
METQTKVAIIVNVVGQRVCAGLIVADGVSTAPRHRPVDVAKKPNLVMPQTWLALSIIVHT